MQQIKFGIVGGLGLLAILQSWVEPRRPYPSQLTGAANLRVTNSDDHGMGSLREAILSADRAGTRARINMVVPKVELTAPLPPLINPNGVTIESVSGQTVVNAAQAAGTSILEIRSNNVIISGLRFENAKGTAIVAASQGLAVNRSSFVNCDTAIEIADGGGDLLLEDNSFERNRVGLEADTFTKNVNVRGNKFLSQSKAGIWAVSQGAKDTSWLLDVGGNQFSDNRFGVVAANHHVRIHDNEISLSHEAGVQIFGRGVSVEHNRISDGFAAGIRADNAIDVIIAQNEIYHNRTVAIVLKGSSGSVARKNNLYSNGSGIAFVYGRGEPQNAAIENSVFSQVGEAIIVVGAQPFLKDNVVRFNNMGGEAAGSDAGLKEIESTPAPGAATDDQAATTTGGNKRDRRTNHSGQGQGKASQ